MKASIHTCGNEPDKDGRIVPECDGCWNDANFEGIYTGSLSSTRAFAREMITAIRTVYNPMNADDEEEASRLWKIGKETIGLVERISKDLTKEANDRFSEAHDAWLERLVSEDDEDDEESEALASAIVDVATAAGANVVVTEPVKEDNGEEAGDV